ncbi:MAG: hypothetical protein P8R43_05560 [Planctomycetota bacterium]|nr:hypothetical protein [Planctomycetota bacterium]
MKLGAQQPRLAPVIPGPLLALIVYAVLVRVMSIYGLVTLSFPRIEGPPVDRTPGTALVVVMSVIHLGFAVILVGLFRKSRQAPAGVRRAHLAGCVLGAILLVLLQWSALSGLGVMNSVLDHAGR